MHKSKMLHEVVLAMKSSLLRTPLLASSVMMFFDVSIIWCLFPAKDTTELLSTFLGGARPMHGTHPFLKRKMKRLLMTLPVITNAKRLSAKST